MKVMQEAVRPVLVSQCHLEFPGLWEAGLQLTEGPDGRPPPTKKPPAGRMRGREGANFDSGNESISASCFFSSKSLPLL